MRKKEIEKIPYMTVEKGEKKYKYIACAQIQEIKGEEHLFVEVFRNTKEEIELPKLRMVFTKNDWCMHYKQEKRWSQGSFRDGYGKNIWETGKEKTYMQEEDQETVWSWCRKKREPGVDWEKPLK